MSCEDTDKKLWYREDDMMFAFMRVIDYYKEFDIKEWKDVLNVVDIEFWRQIAKDSRLGYTRFTAEECYFRWEHMIMKYQELKALPKLECILEKNEWYVYKYINWYYESIIHGTICD